MWENTLAAVGGESSEVRNERKTEEAPYLGAAVGGLRGGGSSRQKRADTYIRTGLGTSGFCGALLCWKT